MRPLMDVILLLLCATALAPVTPRSATLGVNEGVKQIIADEAVLANIERAFSGGRATVAAKFMSLREAAGDDVTQLVRQAVLYDLQHEGDERYAWHLPLMLQYLHVTKTEMLTALAPYVEATDPRQRQKVIQLLGGESPEEAYVDFRPHIDYLRSAEARAAGAPLVSLMYRQAPGRAMHAAMRVYARDPDARRRALWAEHVISGVLWRIANEFEDPGDRAAAAAELDAMSKSEHWWARSYVAGIIRRHATMRSDALLKRLAADGDPVVRGALGAL